MHRNRPTPIGAVLAAVILMVAAALVGTPAPGHAGQDQAIAIGVSAKRGERACLAEWRPTADYLSRCIPDHAFVIVPLTYKKIYAEVQNGEVDFILAKLRRTPDDLAEKVTVALLQLPAEAPAAVAADCAGWTIPLNYQPVHDCLRELKLAKEAADVVLQHHERLDGSGYPAGLTGKQIMLEAKILAVADVTEAQSSFRPYRPALGIEAALAEIAAHSGTRYDPQVVTVCCRLFRDQGFAFS